MEKIIKGMAEVLWGLAWADHVEEKRCRSLSGVEITSVMPTIPGEAIWIAVRWAGHIENANGRDVEILLSDAARADGLTSYDDAYAQRFGNCLAYAARGDGVAWEDDHAPFGLNVPHLGSGSETCDLMILAETTCVDCARKRRRSKKA